MLDDLDRQILRLLTKNARLSFREIAVKIGVSTSTVSARVKRLEDSHLVRGYIPDIDSRAMGYELTAIIGLRIAHGKLLDVQRSVAKDERVFAVYDTTGEWDSFILARFKGTRDLDNFVKKVLAIPDVERTNTNVVLNTVKEELRVSV
jgi:Lrp/AsnC family transcriptional regulator for asnA, asnC and gidA